MTKKIKSKGRVDANHSSWVSELLAADCKKAWLHPQWEDTMLKRYNWQYDVKKKDEEKRMDVELQKLVSDMIKSANGGTGLFSQNHQANGVERRSAVSERRRRRRCQAFGLM